MFFCGNRNQKTTSAIPQSFLESVPGGRKQIVNSICSAFEKNSEWAYAGIFADDSISGTNTKKRDEFNRMIEKCMAW